MSEERQEVQQFEQQPVQKKRVGLASKILIAMVLGSILGWAFKGSYET